MPIVNAHKKFSFPFNIYAEALRLECGQADYFHYGIFSSGDEASDVACNRLIEGFLKYLPPLPSSVLTVGAGLSNSGKIMADAGYSTKVTSIDCHLANLGKNKLSNCGCYKSEFEEYEPDQGGGYDAVLLQGECQGIDSLLMLNKAISLLKGGGRFVLADEFALEIVENAPKHLPYLAEYLSLAQRIGFKKVNCIDMSGAAKRMIPYLIGVLQKHKGVLLAEELVRSAEFSVLLETLGVYHRNYEKNIYSYSLIVLEKERTPPLRLSYSHALDQPKISALFKEVFCEEMTPDLWRWKYGDGRGRAILVWRGDELVGHYGGVGRDVLHFGQSVSAVQIGDVMVLSSERGHRGPFLKAAATFLECYIGYQSKYIIGFGFPNERVMRLAEISGLYGKVGSMVAVRWPVRAKSASFLTKVVPVTLGASSSLRTIVDELWAEMAEDFSESIIGKRAWEYLQHRYLCHPSKKYELFLVQRRFSKQNIGVFVVIEDGGRYLLVDVVCPLKNIAQIVDCSRHLAFQRGKDELYTWITSQHAGLVVFNGIIEPLDIAIPANIWSPGPPVDELLDRWWLMAGDTDFL